MKIKLIILIFTFMIPILAFGSDWNHIGLYGESNSGITKKIQCHNDNNCYAIVQDHLNMYFLHSNNQGKSWAERFKVGDFLKQSDTATYNTRDISSPDSMHYFI